MSPSGPSSTEPSPSEPDSPPPVRWGLGDAAAGYVAGLVLSVVAVFVYVAVNLEDGAVPDLTVGLIVSASVGLWAGLVGAPLWATRRKGTGSLADDFGFRSTWGDVPRGLGLGVLTQIIAVPLIYLPLSQLIDTDELGEPARELTEPAQGTSLLLLGLLLVLVAPAVEELFFRGLLLRSLARRWGDRWAVGGSAFAFGIAHFQTLQFPALFLFGVLLGILAIRTGRLGLCIWAHVGFNAVTMAVLAAAK